MLRARRLGSLVVQQYLKELSAGNTHGITHSAHQWHLPRRVPRSATSSPVDVKAIESRLAQERPPHSNAASRRTPPAPPRVCARPRAGSSNCAGMQQ
eukprot:scaffold127254_cov23-Tisochrysis_lutea.AAC.1